MRDDTREENGGSVLHPLRKARQERNLSMRAVARVAGLAEHTRLYEWETGRHVPTLPYAGLIAPVLGFESGTAIRAACRDWIAVQGMHSHTLVFATQEQRRHFLAEPLPARTSLIDTTDLEQGEYAAHLMSRGVLSEETRRKIEEQFHPQEVEWNVRGQFEWGVESAHQQDELADD